GGPWRPRAPPPRVGRSRARRPRARRPRPRVDPGAARRSARLVRSVRHNAPAPSLSLARWLGGEEGGRGALAGPEQRRRRDARHGTTPAELSAALGGPWLGAPRRPA